MTIFQPTISVIVPVYKVEQYLPQCIESILNQTFADFELLLINDGSPDCSGEICNEYAAKDSRIRVFHKENGGVSSARNLGLDKVRGKWVSFVDSDDFIDSCYLERLYFYKDNDLVVFGYIYEYNHNKLKVSIPSNTLFLDSQKYEASILGLKLNFLNSPWSKLFSNVVISNFNLRFDLNLSYGEDHIFVLEYTSKINSILFVSEAHYHYCRRDMDSLTSILVNPSQILDYVNKASALMCSLDIMNKCKENIDKSFYNYYYQASINAIILDDPSLTNILSKMRDLGYCSQGTLFYQIYNLIAIYSPFLLVRPLLKQMINVRLFLKENIK